MKPDGKTIEAFGYDAENKYFELAEEKMHYRYYYFKRFKMMLHEKIVSDLLGHCNPVATHSLFHRFR